MSDFHVGDLVYVKSVGTVTEVDRLVILQHLHEGRNTLPKLLGYQTDLGILQSDDMELVRGGAARMTVEMHRTKIKHMEGTGE